MRNFDYSLTRTCGKNFTPVSMAYFCQFYGERALHKVCSVLVRFNEVIKLQSFEFSVSDVIPANVQNISPLVFFAFFC